MLSYQAYSFSAEASDICQSKHLGYSTLAQNVFFYRFIFLKRYFITNIFARGIHQQRKSCQSKSPAGFNSPIQLTHTKPRRISLSRTLLRQLGRPTRSIALRYFIETLRILFSQKQGSDLSRDPFITKTIHFSTNNELEAVETYQFGGCARLYRIFLCCDIWILQYFNSSLISPIGIIRIS